MMMREKALRFLHIGAFMAFGLSLALAAALPAFAASTFPRAQRALVGPKAYYLALGDSLAFGYQPDLDWSNGYANYFYENLKTHGVTHFDNLACIGETTATMIRGGCPFSLARKYVYLSSQLNAAVDYLHQHAGQVSPVTLDIGGSNLLSDLNTSNCSINPKWSADLATVNSDLTDVILPQLIAAMTINGQITGDLLLVDYYDPYQNSCPNTVTDIQQIDAALANDASLNGHVTFVDVFAPFGGATVPNPNICNYTWICSISKDFHARNAGYSVMANAIEQTIGYY
jgi:lysophospholipase L1-like esterase